jgi:hypothetical protein
VPATAGADQPDGILPRGAVSKEMFSVTPENAASAASHTKVFMIDRTRVYRTPLNYL